MKSFYYVLFFIISSIQLCAQNTGHIPVDYVIKAAASKDKTKFITASRSELILWDYRQKKPLWIKRMADFGIPEKNDGSISFLFDSKLNFMILSNKGAKKFVDLNTFASWDCSCQWFTADDKLILREYSSKSQQWVTSLYTHSNQSREKIYEDDGMMYPTNFDHILLFTKSGKDKFYDINAKKTIKKLPDYKNYNSLLNGPSPIAEIGEYIVNFHNSTIKVYGKDLKEIKSTPIENKNSNVSYSPGYFVNYSTEENTVSILEHKLNSDKSSKLSVINTYNFLTGELLDRFELMNTSTDAIAKANAISEKNIKLNNEEYRISQLPENLLKARLNVVRNNYYISKATNRIYQVDGNKPLYENNLVSMQSLTPKGREEVFERLENLENASIYQHIKYAKTCPYCSGKGSNSTYNEKIVADYEYTSGKKIVKTTTITNACGSCGGCGAIPVL